MNTEGVQGATFGMMEAIVMMLGVLLGLSITGDRYIVIVAMLMAGLADAFANSAGFHVSQETEKHHRPSEVLKSTLYTFVGTIVTVVILVSPIIFLPLAQSIIVSFALGVALLVVLGFMVGHIRNFRKAERAKLIIEYVIVGVVVAFICYGLGFFVTALGA
jgi:VIT1/CCC1 family predicted Fe2+/Mn2+ transporter